MSETQMPLGTAAEALGLTPLEVLAQCCLLRLPCPEGRVESGYIDIIRSAGLGSAIPDVDVAHDDDREKNVYEDEESVPSDPQARRLWVLRRVLGKTLRTGKIWPACIEPRSLVRGVPDVGLGLVAVGTLERAGLLTGTAKRGDEHRVGLTATRRADAEHLIETGETNELVLRHWIDGD